MNEELRELRGADRGMGLEPRATGGDGVERKDQDEGEEGWGGFVYINLSVLRGEERWRREEAGGKEREQKREEIRVGKERHVRG
jgi:hypothetical protein